MQKEVIILGASGHAKVIAESIIKSGDLVVGFLDDNDDLQGKEVYLGIKVIGKTSEVVNFPDKFFVIGIGSNNVRKMFAEKYPELNWYIVIHPSAIIASDVQIGEGTVIMPGVVINPGTTIGKHSIVNTGTTLDHDNTIGDYVHISPGTHLAGTVTVGDSCWICAGVTVINNVSIASGNIVGAGAVVLHDITENDSTYVGVPIRKIKQSR